MRSEAPFMVLGTQDNPPPSYPGRANFSPVSLTSSKNRLHGNHQLVSEGGGGGGQLGGELSHLSR